MCTCKRLPPLLGCRWSVGAGDLIMHPPPRDTSGRETQGAWRHTGQSPGRPPPTPAGAPAPAVSVHPRRPVEWRQGAGRGSSHPPRSAPPAGPRGRQLRRAPALALALAGRRPPQHEEESFPLPLATAQPVGDCHTSANEKPLYSELPVRSNRLLVPKGWGTPVSHIKQRPAPLFPR